MNTEWPKPSDPDLDQKIMDIAHEKGVSFDDAVQEFVDEIIHEYREDKRNEWVKEKREEEDTAFRAAVQKGIEAADRGDLIDHEEVGRMVEGWIKEKTKSP